MTQTSVTQLFKDLKQDKALKSQLKTATNLDSFVQIATQYGYNFTSEELQTKLEDISEEELAAVTNPGIAPRHHIVPR